MIFKSIQKGFSLFFVMILMLVIAFIVIMTSQSSLTEMRSSTNEADRKFALSLAENGLREGEFAIKAAFDARPTVKTFTTFTADCKNGWCLPAKDSYSSNQSNNPFKFDTATAAPDIPAWERCAANPISDKPESCPGKTVLDAGCDTKKRCMESKDGKTYYIVEYLGSRMDNVKAEQIDNFRVTSRARGNNDDTVVTLQSYVELIRQ